VRRLVPCGAHWGRTKTSAPDSFVEISPYVVPEVGGDFAQSLVSCEVQAMLMTTRSACPSHPKEQHFYAVILVSFQTGEVRPIGLAVHDRVPSKYRARRFIPTTRVPDPSSCPRPCDLAMLRPRLCYPLHEDSPYSDAFITPSSLPDVVQIPKSSSAKPGAVCVCVRSEAACSRRSPAVAS